MKAERSAQEPKGAPSDGADSKPKRWFKRPWSIVSAVAIVGAVATALILPGEFSRVRDRSDEHEVSATRIGEFEFTRTVQSLQQQKRWGHQALAQARRAGTLRTLPSILSCIVEWRNLGLTAQFVTPVEDACSKGYFCFAGTPEWTVGDSQRTKSRRFRCEASLALPRGSGGRRSERRKLDAREWYQGFSLRMDSMR